MEEHINFAIYVKRHIITEDNDYRCEFDFQYCQVERSSTVTIAEYLKQSTDILEHLGVTGDYRIYYDLNCHSGAHHSCRLVPVLTAPDRNHISQVPYGGTRSCVYLQLVPLREIWYKHVLLDDEQIEAAKKIMEDVDKRPFKRQKCSDAT